MAAEAMEVFLCFGTVEALPERPEDAARLVALLDPQERARQAAFRHDADRQVYLLAHAMKRVALSRVLGTKPEALTFVYDPSGKPSLTGSAQTVGFSLSHGWGAAAVAIAATTQIGVDIEALNRPFRVQALMTVMSDAERDALRAMASSLAAEAALRLWTAREALMKALGLGLTMPREAVVLHLTERGPELACIAAEYGPRGVWHLVARDVAPRHVMACAVRHDGPVLWHVSSLDGSLAAVAALRRT